MTAPARCQLFGLFFLVGRFGSPTKIDYRKRVGSLILSSLLEHLAELGFGCDGNWTRSFWWMFASSIAHHLRHPRMIRFPCKYAGLRPSTVGVLLIS